MHANCCQTKQTCEKADGRTDNFIHTYTEQMSAISIFQTRTCIVPRRYWEY